MQLVRYENPVALAGILDEMFECGYSQRDRNISGRYPNVDIIEEKDIYRIKADLPGMKKEDISIKVENGVLSINGHKKQDVEKCDKDNYYHFERSYGEFTRAFNLPETVNSGSIRATYINGVLELELHKTEAAKPKTIEVKVE